MISIPILKHNNIINFRANNQSTAIENAVKTSRRFEENGFPNDKDLLADFVTGEVEEFKQAVKNNDRDNMEEELGDILFDTIMLADAHKINPKKALERTTQKINDRFDTINTLVDKPVIEYPLQDRLNFWKQAKIKLHQG